MSPGRSRPAASEGRPGARFGRMTTPTADPVIAPVRDAHVPALTAIFNHYVEHTDWVFATEPVDDAGMRAQLFFPDPRHAAFTILVDGAVAGFVSVHGFRPRAAYHHTGELSLFLAPGRTGRGLGSAAHAFIVDYARHQGFHALISGIVAGNAASVAMVTRSGFVPVGHFPEVGLKNGRWLDMTWYELLLEPLPAPPPDPHSTLT